MLENIFCDCHNALDDKGSSSAQKQLSRMEDSLGVEGKASLDEMLLESKSLDSPSKDIGQLSIGLIMSEGPPNNLLESTSNKSIKSKGNGTGSSNEEAKSNSASK